MNRITTTIKREWLAAIVAGTKTIEYRVRNSYWNKRLATIPLPFELRLINGMNKPIPEVTVLISKITRTRHEYELHIDKILNVKRWNAKQRCPAQR